MKLVTITSVTLAGVLLAGCGAAEVAASPPGRGTTASPAATSKTHTKHWVTVSTLAGSGNKRGASFHLGDGDKWLVYTVKTNDPFVFAAYVVPKGDSLQRDGGIPEVTADKPGKVSTRLAQDAGDYYVEVMSANARWSAKVQEKR